jgi:hypothetical protein
MVMNGLELSQRANSMKSSGAISRVSCLYETDVSRAISVIIVIIRFLNGNQPSGSLRGGESLASKGVSIP